MSHPFKPVTSRARTARRLSNVAPVLLAFLTAALNEPRSASAFIDVFRPETLGSTCERAQSITVLRVTKFDRDKHIILYEVVKNLKGEFPRDRLRQVAGDANEPPERKHLMEWVSEGKTAVAFRYENRVAICTGDQWSVGDQAPPKEEKEPYTLNGTRTEPWYNGVYFGDADKLAAAVADILAGKEVVVPLMLGRRDEELRQRSGKIVRVRTGLRLKDYNLDRDIVKHGTDRREQGPATRPTTTSADRKG